MCNAFIIAGHKTCACVEVSNVPSLSKQLCEKLRGMMEGDDYDRGALEAARAQANNASLLLERLIALLVAKSVLSEHEINHIIKHFWR
jgi:hypothetical protein